MCALRNAPRSLRSLGQGFLTSLLGKLSRRVFSVSLFGDSSGRFYLEIHLDIRLGQYSRAVFLAFLVDLCSAQCAFYYVQVELGRRGLVHVR